MKRLIFDQRLCWNASMRIITIKSWPLDRWTTPEMKPHRVRYKNACNVCRLIGIRRLDAFLVDLISAVITRLMNGWDYIIFQMIRQQLIDCHVTPLF